jgi:hypothetical protein
MNLKRLGQHDPIPPSSLATCLDFISVWGSNPNRAQLGRLCAASIGVSLDHKKILPKYKIQSADPLSYGHKIMDRLLDSGVTASEIFDHGVQCLVAMAEKLPTESEVEDTANFTQDQPLEK